MLQLPRSRALYGSPCQFASTLAMSTLALLGLLLTVAPTAAQQPSWTKLPSSKPPPARHGHELVYNSRDAVTVLFGGRDHQASSGLLSDTWLWDGSDWTKETSIWPAPGAREGHAMSCFGPTGYDMVLVFGGQNLVGQLDDLWCWFGSVWLQVVKTGAWPAKRADAQLAYDPLRMVAVLFGGRDQSGPLHWRADVCVAKSAIASQAS